jgi:YVTN family beta-propeller protein/VCBS repeat-containing protein
VILGESDANTEDQKQEAPSIFIFGRSPTSMTHIMKTHPILANHYSIKSYLIPLLALCVLFPPIRPLAQGYRIEQVTSGSVDHIQPSINNNGDIVWVEEIPNESLQVMKLAKNATSPTKLTCPGVPYSTGIFPSLANDSFVTFRERTDGCVGDIVRYTSPCGAGAIVEFCSRNFPPSGGVSHRDPIPQTGISSDGSYLMWGRYFFNVVNFSETRRFFVNGNQLLPNEPFVNWQNPSINKDGVYVVDDGAGLNSQIFRGNALTPSQAPEAIGGISGDDPCINDVGDIAYVSIGLIKMRDHSGKLFSVGLGGHPAINGSGVVVFERFISGFMNIFRAVPVTVKVEPTDDQKVSYPPDKQKAKWRPGEDFVLSGTGFNPGASLPQFQVIWSSWSDAQFEESISPSQINADGTFSLIHKIPASSAGSRQVTEGKVTIVLVANPAVAVAIDVDGSMQEQTCDPFDGQMILTDSEFVAGPWLGLSTVQRVAAIEATLQALGQTPKALANLDLSMYVPGLNSSAAELIEAASSTYHVNPQIIITTLEKEQHLVSGTYSRSIQGALNNAMGRCPPLPDCAFKTFPLQIESGTSKLADFFNGLQDPTSRYSPPDGSTPWRLKDCHWLLNNGGSIIGWIAPKNAATGSLWIYTPDFPTAQNGSNYDFWRIWHNFGFSNGGILANCPQSFVLRAFSPVRVVITDNLGRRTGLEPSTGAQVVDIPGSSVTEFPDGAHFITIPNAEEGQFAVDISPVGVGGDYLIAIDSIDSSGKVASDFFVGGIQSGTIDLTEITVSNGEATFNNHAPVCDSGGPYGALREGLKTSVLLNGTSSTDPDGDALQFAWSSDCEGLAFDDTRSSTPTLTINTSAISVMCNITLRVTDAKGLSCSSTTTITISDVPPLNHLPTCPADDQKVVHAQGPLTQVQLDGSQSSDPDGDPLTFAWSVSPDSDGGISDPSSAITTGLFPVGMTLVTLTVDDGRGGVSICQVSVTVQDSTPAGGLIYWSTAGEIPAGGPASKIRRSNLDGSCVQTIIANPVSGRFGGIAFDAANGKLYSGDGSFLFRANLDGSGRENLVNTAVTDVELDLTHGKVYWSDTFTDLIQRANLDGSGVETIQTLNFVEAVEGLAVDPVSGKLFIAYNTSPADSSIGVMNLDGTGRSIFKDLDSTAFPFDIEMDLGAGLVYWNEYGNKTIRRTAVDGNGPIELVAGPIPGLGNGMHLDARNQKIYFFTGANGSSSPVDMNRMNTDGSGTEFLVHDLGRFNYVEVLHTDTVLSCNSAPVARCKDVTVAASSDGSAFASIDDGSSDPDGDAITISQEPAGPYAVGSTTVQLTVADSHGASSSCSATVTVLNGTGTEGSPQAYVTNSGDDTVSVISLDTLSVVNTIHVGDSPTYLAGLPDGSKVYIINTHAGNVSVIDPVAGAVIKTIVVGADPIGIATSPNGKRVYVANEASSSISIIDTASDTVISTISTPPSPRSIAFHPIRDEVWIGYNRPGTVLEARSTADQSVLASLSSSSRLYASGGIVFRPDGSEFFGAEICGACGRFHKLSGNHPGGVITVLQSDILYDNTGSANGMVVSPSNGTVYLAKAGQNGTPRIQELGGGGRSLSFSAPPTEMAISGDSKVLYVVVSRATGFVSIVNTTTFQPIGSVSVGNLPLDILLVRDVSAPPPNQPPIAKCKDITVPASSDGTASASIDDGSSDPDGDAITISQNPAGPFPIGSTSVELTVTDSHGASSSCNATVTVINQAPPIGGSVYWSESARNPVVVSTSIMKANLDGSGVTTVMTQGSQANIFGGIAFDVTAGHLYSGDRLFLFRANLDGSGRVDIVPTSTSSQGRNQVGDVELDLANGKVYWTEGAFGNNAIHRANLDGSSHQVLFNIGFDGGMEGIALDIAGGKLYFEQDVNVGSDTIKVMNLDGTGISVLNDLGGPTAAAHDVEIDPAARLIYWNQLSTKTVFKKDLSDSGASPIPVFTFADGLANGFHFDVQDQIVYVINGPLADQIQRVNADGTGLQTIVSGRANMNYVEVLHANIPTPNQNPVCHPGPGQVVQSTGALTSAQLDGSQSSDPDGDAIEFEWSVPVDSEASIADPFSAVTTGSFPVGTTLVTLTVDDRKGGVSSCQVSVTVQAPAPSGGLIYWSTAGELPTSAPASKIKRSNLDGSCVQTIMANPVSFRFGGIAFDAPNGKLYSGDGSFLFRANLDGSGRENLVNTAVTDVELDLVHGKVYWSDTTRDSIQRANLDGSGVETIQTLTSVDLVEGLAVDPTAGKLFFAYNTSPANSSIKVMGLDGNGRGIFKDLDNAASPFDTEIDLGSGLLYWNELVTRTIKRTALDGNGPIEVVLGPVEVLGNGMHLDEANQKVYFFNGVVGNSGPIDLNRMNTDGTGMEFLVRDLGRFNYVEVLHTDVHLTCNNAPIAGTDSFSTDEDVELAIGAPGVLGNDSDPEGQALSAMLVSGPTHGTLVLKADGSFTYTPAANYFGPDSFVYRASDGELESSDTVVEITVNSVNDAPVAADDSYTVAEDNALNVSSGSGVLANDKDVERNVLTAMLVDGPVHGILDLNADGSFSYIPAANYNGPDDFTYKASDGSALSALTMVSLVVTPVNDAPVAVADSYSVDEDGALKVGARGVLGNDVDVDGDLLSAALVNGPGHGSLIFQKDGSFSYFPEANYNGGDSFSYKANDGMVDSQEALVRIDVRAVNDPPAIAVDRAAVTVFVGETASNSGTWSDPDIGDEVEITASLGTMVKGTGSWIWSYKPTTAGEQTVVVTAKDSAGATATAQFTLKAQELHFEVRFTEPNAEVVEAVNVPIKFSAVIDGPDLVYSAVWKFQAPEEDEEITIAATVQGKSISDLLSFPDAGVYSATIEVHGPNGSSASARLGHDIVIYDAAAGFLTGGGWINSPRGALSTQVWASGKANFSANAKYKNDGTVPEGNLEFDFKEGRLKFKSISYEWLVISDVRAQLKGTGTFDGKTRYSFLATALDGKREWHEKWRHDVGDRFRLKIWDESGVVYDNQRGTPDGTDLEAGTKLGGGEIVIHRFDHEEQ